MYVYISENTFLKKMKEEGINEFMINYSLLGDFIIKPLDANGRFESNIRQDLAHKITHKELSKLLTGLNYDTGDIVHGFFKIDKSKENLDSRTHLYKEVLQ